MSILRRNSTSRNSFALPGSLLLLVLSYATALSTGGVMNGIGTAADPYVVMDYADLKAVGTTYSLGAVYRLGADIDATPSATENAGAGFVPIGDNSVRFNGTFHGAGHVIRNLTINRRGVSYTGLFDNNWGTIDSLGLLNVNIKSDNVVGGIVGENRGTVSRCYATGSVYGWGGQVGGLVGDNDGYSTAGLVSECHAEVTVTGGGGLGGLVGQSYYGDVIRCYATGSVTAVNQGAGGLVGSNTVGTITNSFATGPVSGSSSVGGLVGMDYFYYGGSITGSYSTGSVIGTGDKIGGFVGHNFGWSVGTVSGCYSTGSVTGSGANVGGFIGRNENAATSNCYWNTVTSGQAVGIGTNAGTGNVTGLTDAQMRISANFSGWDFSSLWTIRADSTFPGLQVLDDAPFAFTDTLAVARTFPLPQLLVNDCDPEMGRNNLLLNVLSVSQGTINGTMLNLPQPIARGSVTTLRYRVGEIRAADTLWGNAATAILNLTLMSGDGTDADPYLVENYDDLKSVGVTYGLNKVYRLMADIDASPSVTEHGDSGFVPIGKYGSPFTGKFRGAGHVIRNLTINRPSQDTVGLFGGISGGLVDSVGLINASITGRWSVGGLLGFGTGNTIRACYTTGSVKGNGGHTGGLVGRNATGSIVGSYSVCAVTGGNSGVGGLIGYNVSAGVSECYAAGPVTGTAMVGGMVGTNTGIVSDSYATGAVKGINNSDGGFVGSNTGTITRCYSSGTASGSTSVGGFAGVNGASASITGSAWDRVSSGLTIGVGSNSGAADVTSLATSGMRTSGSFVSWNFDTTWTIRADSTYPGLRKVDNAPFAYVDSLPLSDPPDFSTFLLNDCDIESGRSNLVVAVTGIFGDTDRVAYRVGEVRAADTLWGNASNAVIVLPGGGIQGDPYLIATYRDLKRVGTICGLDRAYRLVADIDASPSGTENGDSGFVPIGRYVGAFSTNYPFTGAFHGGGHVIRNLVINRPATDGAGLFGLTSGSTIDSLGLAGGSITGGVGTGALVGRHTDGSRVADCYSMLPVSGSGYVGGLIGSNSGSGAVITRSFTTGPVASAGAYAGGVIGHTTNASTISRCYATGQVTAGSNAGGLIGYNSTAAVSDCYATGPVTAIGNAGGLEGDNASLSATIRNCYATGRVTGAPSGGLVGSMSNGSITSSYWNSRTTGAIRGVGSGIDFAESLATAQMTRASNFGGWSFDTTWIIRTDSTYPGLRHLDNAPFAFDEALGGGGAISLVRLLSNDCDVESARERLVLQIDSIDLGTIDGGGAFAFPDTAALGSIANLRYRIGEVRLSDTLWGNRAVATITRTLPGTGTPGDPYLVGNYSELKMVGWVFGFDRAYQLIADIDASPSAAEQGGSGFIPIGSPAQPFRGIFNGGGYVIRNVTIDRPAADYVGLFGWMTNGLIDSLGVTAVSISGRNVVGGVVGNDSGTVRNCYTTGSVRGNSYVGGVAGLNFAGTTIMSSYSTCAVEATANLAGGLIGGNNGGTIERSYATGPVSGSAIVGGFVGNNIGIVRNSYATGTVQAATGPLGGFAGSSGNGGTGEISHSYSSGTVTGGTITGGFVGYNGNGSWIGYSYWDSVSSGRGNGFGSNLGGAFFSGLSSDGMRASGSFSEWAFDTTWTIRQDSTYPGLASLQNAPFAFADTFVSVTRNVDLSRLLLNDSDIESGSNGLFLRVSSLTVGSTDSIATMAFPEASPNLTVSIISYRVGEMQGPDTLWGNLAAAVITLDTVVVGVPGESGVPQAFALNQNYPNPFNPSTTIGYALPHAADVTLTVFNTLGEQVAVLVRGAQGAGEYQVRFDAREMATGVYFYTLRAGDFVQTRKLVLVK